MVAEGIHKQRMKSINGWEISGKNKAFSSPLESHFHEDIRGEQAHTDGGHELLTVTIYLSNLKSWKWLEVTFQRNPSFPYKTGTTSLPKSSDKWPTFQEARNENSHTFKPFNLLMLPGNMNTCSSWGRRECLSWGTPLIITLTNL